MLSVSTPATNNGPVSATNLALDVSFISAETNYGNESRTYEYRLYQVCAAPSLFARIHKWLACFPVPLTALLHARRRCCPISCILPLC